MFSGQLFAILEMFRTRTRLDLVNGLPIKPIIFFLVKPLAFDENIVFGENQDFGESLVFGENMNLGDKKLCFH